jgi:hypothetical protein
MINDDIGNYYNTQENVDLKMRDNSPEISCMRFKENNLNNKDIDFNIWIDKLLEGANKSDQDGKIESLLRIIGGDDGK